MGSKQSRKEKCFTYSFLKYNPFLFCKKLLHSAQPNSTHPRPARFRRGRGCSLIRAAECTALLQSNTISRVPIECQQSTVVLKYYTLMCCTARGIPEVPNLTAHRESVVVHVLYSTVLGVHRWFLTLETVLAALLGLTASWLMASSTLMPRTRVATRFTFSTPCVQKFKCKGRKKKKEQKQKQKKGEERGYHRDPSDTPSIQTKKYSRAPPSPWSPLSTTRPTVTTIEHIYSDTWQQRCTGASSLPSWRHHLPLSVPFIPYTGPIVKPTQSFYSDTRQHRCTGRSPA